MFHFCVIPRKVINAIPISLLIHYLQRVHTCNRKHWLYTRIDCFKFLGRYDFSTKVEILSAKFSIHMYFCLHLKEFWNHLLHSDWGTSKTYILKGSMASSRNKKIIEYQIRIIPTADERMTHQIDQNVTCLSRYIEFAFWWWRIIRLCWLVFLTFSKTSDKKIIVYHSEVCLVFLK